MHKAIVIMIVLGTTQHNEIANFLDDYGLTKSIIIQKDENGHFNFKYFLPDECGSLKELASLGNCINANFKQIFKESINLEFKGAKCDFLVISDHRPPFSIVGKNREIDGIEITLLEIIASYLNLDLVLVKDKPKSFMATRIFSLAHFFRRT